MIACNAISRISQSWKFSTARDLHATLVLEIRAPHFSTGAFISDLIAQPNLRGRHPNRRARVKKKEKEER
jgi:hypothetical protein